MADDDAAALGGDAPPYRPTDVASVRAVVVDANMMGDRGDLRLATLRRLSELADRDGRLEIWVPEPVLWE